MGDHPSKATSTSRKHKTHPRHHKKNTSWVAALRRKCLPSLSVVLVQLSVVGVGQIVVLSQPDPGGGLAAAGGHHPTAATPTDSWTAQAEVSPPQDTLLTLNPFSTPPPPSPITHHLYDYSSINCLQVLPLLQEQAVPQVSVQPRCPGPKDPYLRPWPQACLCR